MSIVFKVKNIHQLFMKLILWVVVVLVLLINLVHFLNISVLYVYFDTVSKNFTPVTTKDKYEIVILAQGDEYIKKKNKNIPNTLFI